MEWLIGQHYRPARAAILLDMACTAAEIPLCIGYADNQGATAHHPHGASSFVRDTDECRKPEEGAAAKAA